MECYLLSAMSCRRADRRWAVGVYDLVVGRSLSIDLDDDQNESLTRIAGSEADVEALAHAVLVEFLDTQAGDADRATEIIDRIPGAWERALEGRAQIDAGQGIPLDRF